MSDGSPDLDGLGTGFEATIGLEYDHLGADEMRAHVEVSDRHLQPFGLVHGGLYASIAESVASVGTQIGVGDAFVSSGMSNNTSFLRPAFDGDRLDAVGRPIHRGRTTWIWDVVLTGKAGKTIATTRVTIAVRDRPQS